MVQAIIFDCFGVLVEDTLKVLAEKLDPAKRMEVTDALHASHHGLITAEESTHRVVAALNMTLTEYRQQIDDGEVKNRPLLEYIAGLRGYYKTAILSNISIGGLSDQAVFARRVAVV